MSLTKFLTKNCPSSSPGCSHYCDFPSQAALYSPDAHCVAHIAFYNMSSSENIALASDDNIDRAAHRISILHCILGYEVPASQNPVPPLPATEIMPTIAPNLPAPKIMPTIAPNSTVTEGGLSPELLSESGVNGPVIDPKANA